MLPLWDHQKKCVELAIDKPNFAFFLEMGTGKTAIAIHLLMNKTMDQGHIPRTLIVCPPVVINNWYEEFKKHSKIHRRHIHKLYGPGKKRVEQFDYFALSPNQYDKRVFITNYESLLMKKLYPLFFDWRPEILIFDESHKCKDIKAKRTKLAIQLSSIVPVKYILTGTPVLNTPMDIFSQFLILDGGETFGKNFYAFRNVYFYDRNANMPKFRYFPDWRIKEGSLEKINTKIYQKAIRIKKTECLDLPPLVREVITVDMLPGQKKLYEEMRDHLITFLDDTACVANLAITKALRLQQIVSGYIKMEDGSIIDLKGNPRQKALEELLADLCTDHKVLVWAVFHQNYKQIREVCKKLKLNYVECHGQVNQTTKDESIDAFNNDPDCRVFIGHPRSGGIGINLAVSNYSIWYSRNFSLEDDLQAESRNHRGGSEIHAKITRIDLMTPDTIDEIVLKALLKKEVISEKTLTQLKDEKWKMKTSLKAGVTPNQGVLVG